MVSCHLTSKQNKCVLCHKTWPNRSVTERRACDLYFWCHLEKFLHTYMFPSPSRCVLNRWDCTDISQCPYFYRKRGENMSENPLFSLPGRGGIFHNLLKVSVLDADEQKLLSSFSNTPMEPGKIVRSGSSPDELLETVYKASICSSKRILGLAQPHPSIRLSTRLCCQQQFPSECPLGWKEHLVRPYGAGQ